MNKLTHLDDKGEARMVDVTDKAVTAREARAEAILRMAPETLRMILDGEHPKGDVLAVARIAGIMAAKKTHELIPLCHSLNLTSVKVDLEAGEDGTSVVVASLVGGVGRIISGTISAISSGTISGTTR